MPILEIVRSERTELMDIMREYTEIMDKFISYLVIPAFDNFTINNELLTNNPEVKKSMEKWSKDVMKNKKETGIFVSQKRKDSGMD